MRGSEMLWEFWGDIISGLRDKESLCERRNVFGLSPGRILDGRMGNTFWGKGGCISLSSLRSGHQDRIRHARDLLGELSVKGQREDLRSRERLQTTMHFWPLWKRRKEGGRRKSQTSTHFWEGLLWGVLRSETPFRGNWVSQEWVTSVLLLVQSLTGSSPREAQVWLKCGGASNSSSWSHNAPQSRRAGWHILMASNVTIYLKCPGKHGWGSMNKCHHFKIKNKAISEESLSFSKGFFFN